MKRTVPTRGLAVGAAGLLLAASAFAPATAAERTAAATARYDCALKFDGQDDTAAAGQKYADESAMTMQLQVPTVVSPGQVVSLRGTAALQLSEEMDMAEGYLSTVEGYSDTLSVAVTVNGKTFTHRANRWQTGKTALKSPFVVKGGVTFPTFTVPANAVGSIKIALPQNNVVDTPLYPEYSDVKTVAFTARATASGSMGTYNYDVACYQPTPTAGVIAEIPVASAGSAATGNSGKSSSGGSGSTGSGSAAASGSASDPLADPFAAALTEGDDVLSADEQAAAQQTAQQNAVQGVYMPAWALILLGAVATGAACGYALLTRYRLGILRAALDE
ncbi:MAG: hypothetical protein QM597_00875 [Aeromicrobium sp.]|uniref:hypothetical protein n=1 Tax=Aeromicrobium sp. TaxID=1871063 RepID=UPI0039E5035B